MSIRGHGGRTHPRTERQADILDGREMPDTWEGGGTMKADGFGHETPFEGATNDWITPRWIIDAFGPGYFDLDPCASLTQPWKCARESFTIEDDGLLRDWPKNSNIFLNPPYGPHTHKWVERLAGHGQGIALIFARVETKLWQDFIFPTAHGFLFPRTRIQFCRPDGTTPKSSSGAPSALIAWGNKNRGKLIELVDSGAIPGAFMEMAFYTGSRTGGQERLAL